MFGTYQIPFDIEKDELSISFTKIDSGIVYKRASADGKIEKITPMSVQQVLIAPVEPLHKPKKLAEHLLIDFDRPLLIAPKTKKKIYLRFPVEIGVFLQTGQKYEIIDVVSLNKQKLSMYGDIKRGVLCKHWKSPITTAFPENVNRLYEGIIELEISNADINTIEVQRVVFNVYGIEMYYNQTMVAMRAQMSITNHNLAETSFIDSPIVEGMTKFIGQYIPPKILPTDVKYKMERGL